MSDMEKAWEKRLMEARKETEVNFAARCFSDTWYIW